MCPTGTGLRLCGRDRGDGQGVDPARAFRDVFAGSVALMIELVENLVRNVGIGLAEAVRMASATPAAIRGLCNRGVLALGYRADVVVFSRDFDVKLTVVGGRIVYERPSLREGDALRVGIAGPGGVARVHARGSQGRTGSIPGRRVWTPRGKRRGVRGRVSDSVLHRVGSLLGSGGRGDRLYAASCNGNRPPCGGSGKARVGKKPLTTSIEEADLLIQEARGRLVKLGVVFRSRFEDDVKTLVASLRSGRLGSLLCLSGVR